MDHPVDEEAERPWEKVQLPRHRYRRTAVLARVRGPGTLLQVFGILLCLAGVGLGALVGVAASGFFDTPDMAPDPERFWALWLYGMLGLFLVSAGCVVFLGGSRMKALRSYWLVLTAIILIFLTAPVLCGLLALAGIWPLVILHYVDVQAAFADPNGRHDEERSGTLPELEG